MTMKKSLSALFCTAALAACQQQSADTGSTAASGTPSSAPAAQHQIDGETVVIKTAQGDVTVPLNPERIAVYDNGMADNLNKLGVKIGLSTNEVLVDYLKPVLKDAKKGGTLFEPDLEALNEYKPQLIIIGSRMAKAREQLEGIAPTVDMTADTANMRASMEERIDALAKVFKKEAEAEKVKAEIEKAFAEAKAATAGKGKGLVLLVNGGKLSAFGPTSRLGGWLHNDLAIPPVDESIKEGSHGQPVSFEYVKEKNPDWLFVLDRTAAIGEEGQAAKDVLDNPLVAETTAWKKGQVVYLSPAVYLAAGGAQQMIDSANQVKAAFDKTK